MSTELSRREKLALFQEQKRQNAIKLAVKSTQPSSLTNLGKAEIQSKPKAKTTSKNIASNRELNGKPNNLTNQNKENMNVVQLNSKDLATIKKNEPIKMNEELVIVPANDSQDEKVEEVRLQSLLGFDHTGDDSDDDNVNEKENKTTNHINIVSFSQAEAASDMIISNSPPKTDSCQKRLQIESSSVPATVPEGFKGRKKTRVNFQIDNLDEQSDSKTVVNIAKTPNFKSSKKSKRKPTPHNPLKYSSPSEIDNVDRHITYADSISP